MNFRGTQSIIAMYLFSRTKMSFITISSDCTTFRVIRCERWKL